MEGRSKHRKGIKENIHQHSTFMSLNYRQRVQTQEYFAFIWTLFVTLKHENMSVNVGHNNHNE